MISNTYLGVVESRNDPLKMGRVRVRVLGLHTHNRLVLPVDDLPWATIVQPSTSSSMSGLGLSPTGLVEGSWVLVQFLDQDNQFPLVIGTLAGKPDTMSLQITGTGEEVSFVANRQEETTQREPFVSRSDQTEVVTAQGQRQPITPLQSTAAASAISVSDWMQRIKVRLGELESSNRYHVVNQFGFAGKYQFGALALVDVGFVRRGTKRNTDLNTPDVWLGTLGVASLEDWLANHDAQETAMDRLLTMNYRRLPRLGVPVSTLTDPQKGGLLCVAHLLGVGGARNFYRGVDSQDGNGVSGRHYYNEGYRAVAGVAPAPASSIAADSAAPNNAPQASGNRTSGATATRIDEQRGVSVSETTAQRTPTATGFFDPNGVYPLKDKLGEPDTNRLVRHERVDETIVKEKETSRATAIEMAVGGGTWEQPPVPYNAEYPFNVAYFSESGHLFEIDDSPGAERLHLYHRKGTFLEIDHNGTQVNRIVGDGVEVFERNGYVLVRGNAVTTIEGAASVLVKDALNVEVSGATTLHCGGEVRVVASGDVHLHSASNMNLVAGGDLRLSSGGTISMDAAGGVDIAGARIDLNSRGASPSAPQSIQVARKGGGTPVTSAPLIVFTRADRISQEYEVTSDDPPEQRERFKEEMVRAGIVQTLEELDEVPDVIEEAKAAPPPEESGEFVCGLSSMNQTTFTGREQLSRFFTLSDLTHGYTRRLVTQNGASPAEIFCSLKAVAQNILDPIRIRYPNMRINSGLRLGSSRSMHNKGQAVDLSFGGVSRSDLFLVAKELRALVPYDQFILEYTNPGGNGWIHISHRPGNNRGQIFTAVNHRRVSPNLNTLVRVY